MKFSAAALLVAATGAAAGSNVTYVTEVVESYTTYCPYATQITHGSHTYTITAPTTLTVTDCPCTITRPITTTALLPPPTNATWTTAAGQPTGGAGGSGSPPGTGPGTGSGSGGSPSGGSPPGTTPGTTPSSAGKVAVLSGGALAAVVGLAAFIL